MNHEFCINCGVKNVFEISKPKFCSGCGSPFNTSFSSSSPKRKNDEEEGYIPQSFDLKALRASIVAETNKSKTSLDDLWSDPAPKDPNGIKRSHSSDPSGAELLKKTMLDCAQVKEAKDIDG